MKRTAKQPALGDIQRLMFDCLRRPLTKDECLQPRTARGRSTADLVATFIKPNDRLTSFERLELYAQQYWWRLLGSFSEDFRGLRAVLGEKKFDRLALAYIEAQPSRSWTLRNLGERLESFLLAHPAFTAPRTRLALDVVRVEWARTVAFDGPERRPIHPQKLAGADAASVKLKLQPHITLLELTHPVDRLFAKLKRTAQDQSASSNAVSAARASRRARVDVRPSRAPIHLAVHRVNCSVYYKRLEPEACILLSAIQSGATLADACGVAFLGSKKKTGDITASISKWFATWTELGWLC